MVFAGAPARAGQLVAEYPYPNPRASAALTLGRSPRFASAMAASSEPMIATAASLATRAPDGIRTDILLLLSTGVAVTAATVYDRSPREQGGRQRSSEAWSNGEEN